MINCWECGKEASRTAKQCPHCGARHPASKAAAIGEKIQGIGCLLTIFITIPIILAVCFVV